MPGPGGSNTLHHPCAISPVLVIQAATITSHWFLVRPRHAVAFKLIVFLLNQPRLTPFLAVIRPLAWIRAVP